MFKILQARLQKNMNHEFPDVQAGFRKGRGTKDQIANIDWIIKKASKSSTKISASALLTTPKSLTVWITTNCKFVLQEMGIPDHLTCLLRNLYVDQEATVRTRHAKMNWFQIGKGVRQDYILSSAYLTYMQSTSCEMPGWMNHKLESSLLGEISITSDMQMTPPLWQKVKKNYRASWWKWKEESEKAGLKLNIQKTNIRASDPITSWQIDGETMETVTLFWGAPKSLQMVTAAMKLRHLLLRRKVMTTLDGILKSRDIT